MELVKLTQENQVAFVTLNNPTKHNALNGELVKSFSETIKTLQSETQIKAVVIKGEGKHFCAGADIHWMKSLSESSFEENKHDALLLAELLYDLYHLPKPTVALVQGAAMGGALGLMACCDLVIAHPEAKFGFTEMKIGLVPAVISPYVIAAIGMRQARRYFLTGELFSAVRAEKLGLVHLLSEELDKAVNPFIDSFVQYSSSAMAITKELISHISYQSINLNLAEKTAEINARVRTSKEGQEGLRAFIEKRKPVW